MLRKRWGDVCVKSARMSIRLDGRGSPNAVLAQEPPTAKHTAASPDAKRNGAKAVAADITRPGRPCGQVLRRGQGRC